MKKIGPFSRCILRLLLLTVCMIAGTGCRRSEVIDPMDSTRIELTHKQDGETLHLADNGNIYREIDSGKKWEYYATVFDPEEVKRAYVTEADATYRVAPDTQERYAVRRELSESFEDVPLGLAGIPRLVDAGRFMWGSFTLQSPQAASVAEYNLLRNDLVHGKSDFRDARIEATQDQAHSGRTSLKFVAAPKSSNMVTCKASLSSPLVYFRNGDDFWYEAYYWVEDSLPLTLVDLETELVAEHPGIRLYIFDDQTLGAELKSLDKPKYRQSPTQTVKFPRRQWVHVRWHLLLSASEGRVEIWQDGQQILDAVGPTLPFQSAIYNSLEVGISAYSKTDKPCVLYLDDIRVSSTGL